MNQTSNIRIPLPLHNTQSKLSRNFRITSFSPSTPLLLARPPKIWPHESRTHGKYLQSLRTPFTMLQHSKHIQRRLAHNICTATLDIHVCRKPLNRIPNKASLTSTDKDRIRILRLEQQRPESGSYHRRPHNISFQALLVRNFDTIHTQCSHTRVIYENVQPSEFLFNMRHGFGDAFFIGDVELEGWKRVFDAGAFDLGLCCIRLGKRAARHDDLKCVRSICEHFCYCEADSWVGSYASLLAEFRFRFISVCLPVMRTIIDAIFKRCGMDLATFGNKCC